MENAVIVNIYAEKLNEVREKLNKFWNTLIPLHETDEDIKIVTNEITSMKVSFQSIH